MGFGTYISFGILVVSFCARIYISFLSVHIHSPLSSLATDIPLIVSALFTGLSAFHYCNSVMSRGIQLNNCMDSLQMTQYRYHRAFTSRSRLFYCSKLNLLLEGRFSEYSQPGKSGPHLGDRRGRLGGGPSLYLTTTLGAMMSSIPSELLPSFTMTRGSTS